MSLVSAAAATETAAADPASTMLSRWRKGADVEKVDCAWSSPHFVTPECAHGRLWPLLAAQLGVESVPPPRLAAESKEEARPGYNTVNASEFQDEPKVQAAKVKLLAELLTSAKAAVTYTGAGISTDAGIADYATRVGETADSRPKLGSMYMAEPTRAHHALVKLFRVGLLKRWIQQNHDGLPQKAGLPQEMLNEIHGAWYDPSNPVVAMSGSLRDDLFADLLQWERDADLCLCLGTSLSGMNADRVAESTAARISPESPLGGLVIINLQRTRLDQLTSLRIYGNLSDVLGAVCETILASETPAIAKKMKLPQLLGDGAATSCAKATATIRKAAENVDKVDNIPYDENGHLCDACNTRRTVLDLSDDARLVITCGPYAGAPAVVTGRDKHANFNLRVQATISRKGKSFKAVVPMKLGNFWLFAAQNGSVPRLPVMNAPSGTPPIPELL